MITAAAKKENKPNKKKKEDSHSFIAKPDEATGPFPEAVLLREVIFSVVDLFRYWASFVFLLMGLYVCCTKRRRRRRRFR